MDKLTREVLAQILIYVEEADIFVWVHTDKKKGRVAGKAAGGSGQRRRYELHGVKYSHARLAWLWRIGVLPTINNTPKGAPFGNSKSSDLSPEQREFYLTCDGLLANSGIADAILENVTHQNTLDAMRWRKAISKIKDTM